MLRRGRLLRLVAGVLTLAALTAACSDETGGGRSTIRLGSEGLILQADRLFDGVHMTTGNEILIRNQRVVDVGPAGSLEGARRVDLGDATILPGFIDLHVHLEASEFDDFILSGVTTVRDLGKALISDASDHPKPGFLRLLESGPLLGPTGGAADVWWGEPTARLVDTPTEARDAVTELSNDGADVIKAYLGQNERGTLETFDEASLAALVEESGAHGLEVVAHVDDAAGVRAALKVGVASLAHIPCFQISDGLLGRLADRMPIVGTLTIYRTRCPAASDNARRFVAMGGVLLYGTDYSSYRSEGTPGLDVDELRALQEVGLTPEQSLSAATALAGAALAQTPLGRLIPGAPADLVVVEGDPLRSLDVLSRPLLVIAGGKVPSGDELLDD